jgi:NAD+ kinase
MDRLDFLLIDRVLAGEYTVEKRMMLDVSFKEGSGRALNDLVVSRTGTAGVVEIEVYCNDRIVGNYRCDGMIVATPTGSTAYALAAGGPVVDPALDCFNIVPICTHTLMARPMLFSAANTIRLVNSGRITVNVSADGSDEYTIDPDEYVSVKRSEHTAKFARIKNNSFYELLRNKMRTDS